MEIRLLGPVGVVDDRGAPVPLGGAKERKLLAALALHSGEPVSEEDLMEILWGRRRPRTARKMLQGHIARLREALAGDGRISIELAPDGYSLRVEAGASDIDRAEMLVAQAREANAAGAHDRAESLLAEAESLWRGPVVGELATEGFALAEAARLEAVRGAVANERASAKVAASRTSPSVAQPAVDSGSTARLPSGVVAFLLTDVEGSTHLWESSPRKMADSLRIHDAIVMDAVTKNGGSLLKSRGEGDSTFSVFTRASQAAAAALDVHRDLATQDWPVEIRVRIAIHMGEAVERDGDYFGPAVNRAARLRAVAEGGEILVSQVAAEILTDHVGGTWHLRELGQLELKDMARPEAVWMLLPEDHAVDVGPPARSSSPSPRRRTAPTRRDGSRTAGGRGARRKPVTSRISVLVVDDHPLWRRTLCQILEHGEVQVVGEAGTADEAVELVRQLGPEVVLMDLDMPGRHGSTAIRDINAGPSPPRVLVLSSSDEREDVIEAVRAGAHGYLLKTAEEEDVRAAVRRIHAGELVFPPALSSVVLSELRGSSHSTAAAPDAKASVLDRLTERERAILELMAAGRSNHAIAQTLNVSGKTVESNTNTIFAKLGLEPAPDDHRRVRAVVAFLEATR